MNIVAHACTGARKGRGILQKGQVIRIGNFHVGNLTFDYMNLVPQGLKQ